MDGWGVLQQLESAFTARITAKLVLCPLIRLPNSDSPLLILCAFSVSRHTHTHTCTPLLHSSQAELVDANETGAVSRGVTVRPSGAAAGGAEVQQSVTVVGLPPPTSFRLTHT